MPSSLTNFWGYQHNKNIRYFVINIKPSRYFNLVLKLLTYYLI